MGDRERNIVHHLANKQKECDIYHIEKIQRKYFTPDLLENAKKKGYVPCKYCVEQS